MGAFVTSIFSSFCGMCANAAQHEIDIALHRCPTCNRLPDTLDTGECEIRGDTPKNRKYT
jgi:hypothetical protein